MKISNDWTIYKGYINVDLFSIHLEEKYKFITIMGISFIWQAEGYL